MMQVKKIQSSGFHNANKLHGSKPHAKYGAFKNGEQVGVVMNHCGLWRAFTIDCKSHLLGYACSSLAELKRALAKM